MNDKTLNIGFIKYCITNSLTSSLINEDVNECEINIKNMLSVISSSEIIKEEYNVCDSLTNTSIENQIIASRFIDTVISKMNKFNYYDIVEEHKKIYNNFKDILIENTSKKTLYDYISNLILESNPSNPNQNIDLLFESYNYIMEHISRTQPKKMETTNECVNESVLNIAINKYNNKYSSLNEDDKKILKTLLYSSTEQKNDLFEELKSDTLLKLNTLKNNNTIDADSKNKINEAINKVDNMDKINIDQSIINLYELNFNLK